MRKCVHVLVAAFAALTLVAAGGPSHRSQVTGGGQLVAGGDGFRGRGDTIAFTALDEAAPRGEVQYVDRVGINRRNQVVRHGDVTCLRVEGNRAVIGGRWRDGNAFEIFVLDNGQGKAAENDLVTVDFGNVVPDCEEVVGNEEEGALARGNVRVHDAQ